MKKIILTLVLLAVIAVSVSSCVFPMGDYGYLRDESSDSRPDFSFGGTSGLVHESTDMDPDFSQGTADNSKSEDITVISSLTELRDFINAKKEADIFEVSFKYTGNKSELDGAVIARIATACYISYSVSNGNEYNVIITEYPGDRAVDAYFSGDDSSLNYDEKRMLDEAKKIVQEARKTAKNDFELELALHDALISKVTYYGGTTEVDDPLNPPRHLTAVGALLDGAANCQGYTDAFYTLASIAGFTVGRMTAHNSDGWHMMNTVKLDGKWYVVDATFDDSITYNDGAKASYRLFNAGRDKCREYKWGEEMEYNPIANKSDSNYFYLMSDDKGEHGYKKTFTSFEDMAQSMLDEWYYNGRTYMHAAIFDGVYDWTNLSDELQKSDGHGRVYSYKIWCHNNGKDTFYIIQID